MGYAIVIFQGRVHLSQRDQSTRLFAAIASITVYKHEYW